MWSCWIGLLLYPMFLSKLNVPWGPANPVQNKYFLQLVDVYHQEWRNLFTEKDWMHTRHSIYIFFSELFTIILLLCHLWAKFLQVYLTLCLPPPASSITGGLSDICRTGAGQTKARAPSLLQNWPHTLQPRHCLRSDTLPGKTAVNTAALSTWMLWYLLVRAEIQLSKLCRMASKGLYLWTISMAFSICFLAVTMLQMLVNEGFVFPRRSSIPAQQFGFFL